MANLGEFYGVSMRVSNNDARFYGVSILEQGNYQVRAVDAVTGDGLENVIVTIQGVQYVTNDIGYIKRINVEAGNFAITIDGAPINYTTITVNDEIPEFPNFELLEVQLAELVFSGIVIKFDAAPIRPPLGIVAPDDVVFCPCDFRCDFEELVFADENGNGITNDFSDFLFKKITSSDTVLIELVKDDIILAEINDDSFGTYYDGFDNQPLYVGWLADWTKVFQAFSGGRYQVKVTSTILGQENIFKSRYFRLNTYDVLSANETVKIETRQNGRFENGEFDFTNLVDGGWLTSIRLKGEFGKPKYNLERDIFEDPSYRQIQNRDQVKREYLLKTYIVPESLLDRIATQDILANQVFITGYDVLQEKKYGRLPVAPESISDPIYDDLGRTFFEISFSDRQQNIIKTNVR